MSGSELSIPAQESTALAPVTQGDFVVLTVTRDKTTISVEDLVPKYISKPMLTELRFILYTRFISQYPFLKNLPKDRFKALFTFNVTVKFKLISGHSINDCRYIPPVHKQSPQLSFHLEESLEFFDTTTHPLSVSFSNPVQNSAEAIQFVTTYQTTYGTKPIEFSIPLITVNEFENELLEVLSKCNFLTHTDPIQLRERILLSHPELRAYFHMDDLTKIALAQPDALADHLRQEIMAAEVAIRALVQSQEITRVEGERRTAALRETIQRLEVEVLEKSRQALAIDIQIAEKKARLEIMESEAVAKINADTAIQRGELVAIQAQAEAAVTKKQAELAALESGVNQLKGALKAIAESNTTGLKIAADVQNVEIISTPVDTETRELRSKISSFIRAHLAGELRTTHVINQDQWRKNKIYIELSPILEAFEVRQKIKKRWFGADIPVGNPSYVIQIGVSAQIRSPASQKYVVDHFTLILENGEITIPPDSMESKRIFFREIEDAAQSVGNDFELSRHTLDSTVELLCRRLLTAEPETSPSR